MRQEDVLLAYLQRHLPPVHPGMTRRDWLQWRRRRRRWMAVGAVGCALLVLGMLIH